MATLNLIVTDAGRAELVNATNTGTLPIVINQIALGSGLWTPDATATALQTEIKRVNAVGGSAVAPDAISVTITDDSVDVYSLGEFGLYTDTGVLFAIYSDPVTPLTDKVADAWLLIANDVVFTSVAPGSVSVSGAGFVNPPATETVKGVVEIATQAEVDAGTDPARVITPVTLAAILANYLLSSSYTSADVLAKLLPVDGALSGLDSDFLDGQHGSFYQNASNLISGVLPALRFSDASHGDRSGGSLHALATSVLAGFMSPFHFNKLEGIEAAATADQTAGEIKTAYESNLDTNALTDALLAKLNAIEAGATADQTAGEIKTAYESNLNTNSLTDALLAKLNAIEAGATADQTAGEIKTAYESNLNTNSLTDALLAKLNAIEVGATADQTAGEIKTAYESNLNTNSLTDALLAKLNAIEAGATADQTGAEILASLLPVDGINSGLDTDLFRGQTPAQFIANNNIKTGFKGALVSMEFSINVLTDTYTYLNFALVEYNDLSIYSAAIQNRLTVPAGVTKIKLSAQAIFALNGLGDRYIYISKNIDTGTPAGVPGVPFLSVKSAESTATSLALNSRTINVVEGDFFSVSVRQNSGGNIQALNSASGFTTYFSMEIIE